ncbi:MAG: tail fiber domain-containing protein, partial [Bacteroidales bacterium]|nr:tail fiber domain-containing protein [Bacteroidales bacterium]
TDCGSSNTLGSYNVFLGDMAGYSNSTGEDNVFIGVNTAANNTEGSYNVFMGSNSGVNNVTGNYNVFLGDESGYTNSTGRSNVFIGLQAGNKTDTGSYNLFMGTLSGHNNVNGMGNVYLGQEAGYSNQSGSLNVAIGPEAGYYNIGESNIFIGSGAGFYETGSNKLYIDNSWSTADEALIYGDFFLDSLSFNADVNITYDLDVGGDVTATGFIEPSDIRWKTNIAAYENAMDKLMQIRGVNFEWKSKENGHWKFPDGNQLGVIAQEVEKVVPELVKTNEEGYKLVDYTKLSVVLIEAVKEQQHMIDKLEKENTNLKTEMEKIDDLQDQIDQLKNMLSK